MHRRTFGFLRSLHVMARMSAIDPKRGVAMYEIH
jgi:hypothetical protein